MKSIEETLKELFKVGTPQCGLIYGIVAIVLGFMLLFLGFFKTLFIALLFTIGLFLGGVKEKREFIKAVANKLFPPQNQ